MTYGDLINNKDYKLSHTSWTKGYVSRKTNDVDCVATPYKGKFGEGYTVVTKSMQSSTYCHKTYFIKNM